MVVRNWADNGRELEDAQSAILYLKYHVAADDLVYVHASASETSKLYFRMLGLEPQRYRPMATPAIPAARASANRRQLCRTKTDSSGISMM